MKDLITKDLIRGITVSAIIAVCIFGYPVYKYFKQPITADSTRVVRDTTMLDTASWLQNHSKIDTLNDK